MGGINMTKNEVAVKLYVKLEQKQDIQEAVDYIKSLKSNGKSLSVNEQLEIVNLIRQIHIERTKGMFEAVDAFLALVDNVETQIKAQSNSESGGDNNADK